ncbi:MAG: hypothetical protein OXC79_07590 [Candidatus Poribacteria bacterium]|nr:hypothetical protein [Candidatus Poribacteria bacterium]
MTIRYTDQEIGELVQERKALPTDWRNQFVTRIRRGNEESHLSLIGDRGNKFRIIIRQNQFNESSFSVVLGVHASLLNQLFRLRRYNGNDHTHTNGIEKVTVQGFHIHFATARYQRRGLREDDYAETTNRYKDIDGAFECLIADANLEDIFEIRNELKNFFRRRE